MPLEVVVATTVGAPVPMAMLTGAPTIGARDPPEMVTEPVKLMLVVPSVMAAGVGVTDMAVLAGFAVMVDVLLLPAAYVLVELTLKA